MAAVHFRAGALEDLERLVSFLDENDPGASRETLGIIIEGLGILARHPLIGRPLPNGSRELVIHRGKSGYLAQYRFEALADQVVVLAVRHQREVDPDE